MQPERPYFLFVLATFTLLAALTTASETVPLEVAKAQTAREQAFKETLDTYAPASPDEQAVISLLQEYRNAFNASDLSRIEPLLAPNFELRYYRPKSAEQYSVEIQSRSKYLEKRSPWSLAHPRQEKLIVNIRGVLLHPQGKGAAIIAATTYKSKYFHPKYIETFGFTRTSNGWLLRRVLVVPTHPKLEELNVQIFVAREGWARDPESNWSQYSRDGVVPDEISPPTLHETKENHPLRKLFRELAVTKRADAIVELHQQKAVKSLPYDEVISVLFVFREPPPIGAKIVTELIYERSYGDYPFRYEYTVEKVEPFFIIENLVRSDDEDGEFIMRVSIDGKMIAERKLDA